MDGFEGDELGDLTGDEAAGYAALPRERVASDLLEERVVRDLRSRGLLSRRGRVARRRARWVAAACSTGLVLFVSGLVVGQTLGSRTATRALLAVREQDAALVAARVQEAGSAYVAALSALADTHGEGSGEVRAQGSEAALAALLEAAGLLSRLSPDDPAVIRVLQALEDSRAGSATGAVPAERIIWF